MTLLIEVFILNVYGLVEQFPIMHFRLNQKYMLLIKYNKYSTLLNKKNFDVNKMPRTCS